MTTLIGIGHTARAGKDTAASALVRDLGYTRIGFADALKDLAMRADPTVLAQPATINVRPGHGRLAWVVRSQGWEDAKARLPEVRRFLQDLGVGARAVLGEDVWVDLVLRKAEKIDKLVIPDVRFPNEAEAIKAAGGFLVKIDRNVYIPQGGHISETALADFEWDLTIPNHSTIADLEIEIVKFAKSIEPRELEESPDGDRLFA